MEIKKLMFIIVGTAMLIGAASATGVNDFTIDKNYKSAYQGEYYSLYLNDNQDSGITVYKNVDDDAYDDIDDDDAYDGMIHDDGQEYTHSDDDFTLEKKSDNTGEFKDMDNAEHGVVEVVKKDKDEYVVVFWAKDSSSTSNSDLSKLLAEFNKDNGVEAISF